MTQMVRGHTYHKRLGAVANAFRYSVDYVLTEPEAQPRLPWPLRRNAWGLFSLNDRDHGGRRGAGRGTAWVREVMAAHQLSALAGMRILQLVQPRYLGFWFNPVGFWLIVDANDDLRAVIAEVNNTFGDRHSYLCHRPDLGPIGWDDQLTTNKVFHVSPFQDVAGQYSFRFDFAPTHFGVRIDHHRSGGGVIATLTGTRVPLTAGGLLWSALRRPGGAFRVLALIYAQALVLRLKGVRFRPRPEPPEMEVTR